MSLHLSWNENEHIVVECVVDGEVLAALVIEESGDAVNKVVHITSEHGDSAEVRFKA